MEHSTRPDTPEGAAHPISSTSERRVARQGPLLSIKIMSRVWECGPEKQADRFVLLAIADYANDDGECWPSIAGICRKTCMSERGVQVIIRRLEAQGWLHIETGKGRRNCNLYTVQNPAPRAPRTTCTPHMDAETPHIDVINPAPRAPEPSYNHQEPSLRDTNVSLALSAPEPASELAEAVAAYNETADDVGWPKVQKMTPARSKALKARLRDCGGIEGWRFAMDKGKASDFLCGRTPKPWSGFGFDWITKQANFTKLMEGNYDNRANGPVNDDPALRAIAAAARAF